ncbi:MAG: diaminopimelate decarboxylase, partial [Gimesia sp.]|nr:diaminopimelate decarboxylase [Gimesia sp.]
MTEFHYQDGELFCENVSVTQLAEEYGTPLWVYSKSAFLGRLKEIQDAFAEVDPVICYSVKANGNLSLLKTMNDAGSSFDVVSGGELFRVQQAGADTSRVVFAGVGKTDEEIRQALKADILMFDVESEAELDAIAFNARELGCIGRVALRLNPDIDAKTHHKTTTGKKG